MITNYFLVLGEKRITELCYYLSYLLDGTQYVKLPARDCLRPRFSVVSFQTAFGKACLLKSYYFS